LPRQSSALLLLSREAIGYPWRDPPPRILWSKGTFGRDGKPGGQFADRLLMGVCCPQQE
jgi:hypothetical protein